MKYKGLTVWSCAAFFFSFQFVLRLAVGILREDILDKFDISITEFGNLAGCYYLGYAGLQIPFSLMLNRYKLHLVAAFGILVTGIGSLAFVSESWFLVLLGRFLTGAGSAVAIPLIAKVSQEYFTDKMVPFMTGIAISIGLLGAVFGGQPMKIVFESIGYHKTFFLLSIISVLISILIYVVLQNNNNTLDNPKELPMTQMVKNTLFNPLVWYIGICGGMMVGSFEGFADVWANPFLQQVHHFTESQSIVLSTLIFVGMAISAPLIGFTTSIISTKSLLLLIALFNALIFSFLFVSTDLSFTLVASLMLGLGFLCAYQMIVFEVTTEFIGRKYFSLIVPFINCINISFGYIFHIIISSIIAYCNSSGDKIYDYHSQIMALSTIPILGLIGGLGFFLLKFSAKNKQENSEI